MVHFRLLFFQALIESGADVRARGSRMDSPLHSAEGAEVTKILVEAGADLEAKEIEGYTPLCTAAANGDIEKMVGFVLFSVSFRFSICDSIYGFRFSFFDFRIDIRVSFNI